MLQYTRSPSSLRVLRALTTPVTCCRRLSSTSSALRPKPALQSNPPTSSGRPPPSFPCVAQHAAREKAIQSLRVSTSSSSDSGPEPPYGRPSPSTYQTYHHTRSLPLTYAAPLPEFDIAYETWGTLSPTRDNVILLHTGLSGSSHAASTQENPAPGWWEKFIGPGRALDTQQFFVVCTNVLGGCYGSTGPSSVDPATGEPYATTFPVISIFDMVRAQFALLDHLGVEKLYASVGSSMGAMQSLAAGWMFPKRVGKVVSISGTARSSPSSIAVRYAQRSGTFLSLGFVYDRSSSPNLQSLWRIQIGTTDSIMMVYRHILVSNSRVVSHDLIYMSYWFLSYEPSQKSQQLLIAQALSGTSALGGKCANRPNPWERVHLHYALIFSSRPISTTRHVTRLLLHQRPPT
jgi:pimeloyl-ACP methyl ester carboxylesterase